MAQQKRFVFAQRPRVSGWSTDPTAPPHMETRLGSAQAAHTGVLFLFPA
jgi:hypothetical protein